MSVYSLGCIFGPFSRSHLLLTWVYVSMCNDSEVSSVSLADLWFGFQYAKLYVSVHSSSSCHYVLHAFLACDLVPLLTSPVLTDLFYFRFSFFTHTFYPERETRNYLDCAPTIWLWWRSGFDTRVFIPLVCTFGFLIDFACQVFLSFI